MPNEDTPPATTISVNIDTKSVEQPLTAALGALAAITSAVTEMKSLLESIHEYTHETRDCILHLHDAHFHNNRHLCEDRFDVECGSSVLKLGISPGELLNREFQNGIDYDNNGLIYGKDFMISMNDSNCPPIVRELDLLMDIFPKEISWNSYIETLPEEYQ